MPYAIRVTPAHERKALIQEALENSIETEMFFYYQNKPTSLPVVRMPISLPVYRMENYRTQVEQREYVRKYRLPADFFELGQENESAQAAQHTILEDFARRGKGDSVTPIRDVLEQEAQQTARLLISSTGVVVNGNRRLAAMRELHADGGIRFSSFSHVECLVLPSSATPTEIKELEVRLQMQPETKLDYGWVEEALAIRDLMRMGHTKKQVADLLRKKEAEVDQALVSLEEAELYLFERLGTPEDYKAVRESEQIFKDMSKAFKKKSGEDLEASRAIAQVLVENSRRVDARVYNYNVAFGEKSSAVLPRLAERLGVDTYQTTPLATECVPNDSKADSDLDIDLSGNDDAVDCTITYGPLIQVLNDPNRTDEVLDHLKDVCDSIQDQSRGQRQGQAALRLVQRANTELGEVDLSQADPRTLVAISNHLKAIIDRASRLEHMLANLPVEMQSAG